LASDKGEDREEDKYGIRTPFWTVLEVLCSL
jgi:hypothetical protein